MKTVNAFMIKASLDDQSAIDSLQDSVIFAWTSNQQAPVPNDSIIASA